MFNSNNKDKRSFFERLSGAVRVEDEYENDEETEEEALPQRKLTPKIEGKTSKKSSAGSSSAKDWQDDDFEGQLTIDMFQTPNELIIKTMIAGVKPEDMDISITRDMVTIRGKREETREIQDEDYFMKELYWGTFSRAITLPQEIEVEEAEASEKNGLLTIRLPKIDKDRETKLKVKSGN